MKKLLAAACLAGLLVPGMAHSAEIFAKVGTFDGQFLKIGVGARAEGMGGAFVAVADDATALYWNPAGIARIDAQSSEISLNHANWPAELSFDQASCVFHLKMLPGALGVQIRALSMQPMEERTAYQPEGTGRTFDAGMQAIGLTYSRSFTDKFSAGVTGNFISEGLDDKTSSSMAFDVGTLYDVGVAGMKIGMAIENIGSEMTFIDRSARIPSIFRVGTSAVLMNSSDQKLIGSFEFSHPPDNTEHMNFGAEYSFRRYLFLRTGYNVDYDSAGLAAGIGMRFPVSVAGKANLDYAYTDMKALGGAHRFSLNFVF